MPLEPLISHLEQVNQRLIAADPEDHPAIREILERRAAAIEQLRSLLEAAPRQLLPRLEQIFRDGQTALARLHSYRAGLHAQWDSQNCDAQWLRETGHFRRQPAHSVDCKG
ncbi:MAG TPA: hypothetical protein VG672_17005 [Bryobacteraceae bacterium]|nr:hypothetical protein [Bryobacteraceae bacterium]